MTNSLSPRRPPAALFLDFDGVVLESVDVKGQAFVQLFPERPDLAPAILDLHSRHGGVSRHRKIALIRAELLGLPPDPQACADLARRFAAIVAAAIDACPFTPGAQAALSRLASRFPLLIVSGTPEEELQEIVRRREIGGFFREVHGSPREKPDILRDALARAGWTAADCLFVGDAMTDCDAAAAVGMPFVGRVGQNADNPFPPQTPIIADLAALPPLLGV